MEVIQARVLGEDHVDPLVLQGVPRLGARGVALAEDLGAADLPASCLLLRLVLVVGLGAIDPENTDALLAAVEFDIDRVPVDHVNTRAGNPDRPAMVAKSAPLGRVATPEDIGEAVVWLASEKAARDQVTMITAE